MKLGTELPVGMMALPSQPAVPSKQDQAVSSFADVLSAQNVAAKNIAARDEILANQSAKKESLTREDIAYIREYGMQAYADKVREEKIEELREKLLRDMGLTEELLQAMSPDQRAEIERIIDREIEKQIAAYSIINDQDNDSDDSTVLNSAIEMRWEDSLIPNDIRLEAIIPGALIGDSMSDVIEKLQTADEHKKTNETG